jgi:carbonic anhydrase/acetyltransferase-like protein (isoleucine patch superfamily)
MIYSYKKLSPQIAQSAFIAPSADIIGDVSIADDSSVWFHVTIRGDVHFIKIGTETNIQDNSLLHVTNGKFPLTIGNSVTVGHHVTLHGCTIGNNVLIGMGAIVLDGVEIGSDSVVAAGSLIRENQTFPDGVLIAGLPAEIKRQLTSGELNMNRTYAQNYVTYKNNYLHPEKFCSIVEEIQE